MTGCGAVWLGAASGEPLGVMGEGSSCPWIEGQLSLSPRAMMTGAEIADSLARYDASLIRTSDCEYFHSDNFFGSAFFVVVYVYC